MADIQFEEPNITSSVRRPTSKSSSMVIWIISTGLVKDENQAMKVLVFAAIIGILATIIVLWRTSSATEKPIIPPEVLMNMRR